jgi:hypothetical protein
MKNKLNNKLIFVVLLGLCALLILLSLTSAADPGHPAASIGTGTFESGNYVFPVNLDVLANFSVGGTRFFVNNATGFIGIGTSSPTQLLDVRGNINVSNEVYVKNGTAVSQWMYNQTSASSSLDTWNLSGTNLFPRSLDYNVSIGSTSSSFKLGVVGDIGITNGSLWQPVYPSDDGLVLYLPFSEGQGTTTYDKSPYGNDGTITGATWTSGKYGNALDFNGTTDYVTVSNSDSINFNTGSFSYGLWVYTLSNTSAWDIPLFKGAASDAGYDIELGGGAWTANIRNQSSSIKYVTLSSSQLDNQWVYLFIVVDRNTNIMYGYLNGNQVASTSLGSGFGAVNNTYNLVIGAQQGGNYKINGTIDEVKVYSRALSADEIRTQYLSGMQSHGSTIADRFRIINTTASRIFEVNKTGLTIGTGATISGVSGKIGVGQTTPSSLFETAKSSGTNEVNLSGVLYVNSTSGNVGIGTNAPQARLDVGTGNIWGVGQLVFNSDTSNEWRLDQVNDALQIIRESSTFVTINNASSVGIGTSSPTQLLDVRGNINVSNEVYVKNGTAVSQWMYNQTSASSSLDTWNLSGTNLFPKSLGYNVGIGTSSPSEILSVFGNILVNGTNPRIKMIGNFTSTPGLELYNMSTRTWILYSTTENDLRIKNNTADYFTIQQTNGNVGIGITSPTHKLSVVNGGVNITTTSATANFRIEETGDVIIGI